MGMGVDYSTSERSYIEQQFQQYESLKDQYANATTQKDKDRIDKQIKEIETYLNDKSQQWLTDSDGIGYITNPQNVMFGNRKARRIICDRLHVPDSDI